jgi:hypothetical protein
LDLVNSWSKNKIQAGEDVNALGGVSSRSYTPSRTSSKHQTPGEPLESAIKQLQEIDVRRK